jgi:DNA-binding LytR/AlgR family response regulator
MRILIIEDEPQAANRLENLVREIVPDATILDKLDTVKRSVSWLKSNAAPDVILMDIQLADGISFQIFEHIKVVTPVIFTTAYDEYAIRAFKVNSVDYILKPVDREELATALQKINVKTTPSVTPELLEQLALAVKGLNKKYKARFVIKVGEHLRTIEVDTILFFYSEEKATFCVTTENRSAILDHTLDELSDMLDPAKYFRINRKYLVSSSSIRDIISYSNSRLKLVLKNSTDTEIIVAREKVQEFKRWLDV